MKDVRTLLVKTLDLTWLTWQMSRVDFDDCSLHWHYLDYTTHTHTHTHTHTPHTHTDTYIHLYTPTCVRCLSTWLNYYTLVSDTDVTSTFALPTISNCQDQVPSQHLQLPYHAVAVAGTMNLLHVNLELLIKLVTRHSFCHVHLTTRCYV